MESSDPVPSHSDDVHRSPPLECSTTRMDTGQRLVDRMPINPKKLAFISTQERFEVPLRPELWPAFAAGAVPASDLQQHTIPPALQQSNVNARGRNKSVRRKGNSSNDPSGVDGGSHGRKRRPTSHRSSRERNCPPDQSTRLTDYYPAHGEREVSTRPKRCRQRSHFPGVGHAGRDDTTNVLPEMHQIHIPRLRDLLSQPLSCLHGRHLQAFHEIFEEFDRTLIENTSAIQVSLRNIVRAPFHLAEKCRPLLEDLVHAQRLADPNSVGEPSLTNNGCREDANIPAAHGPVQPQNPVPPPCAAPQQEACREGNAHTSSTSPNPVQLTFRTSDEDDMQGLNNLYDAIFHEEDSSRSPAVPTSSCSEHDVLPLIPPSPHHTDRESSENCTTQSEPLHSECHSHSKEPYVTSGVSTPVVQTASQDRDSIYDPYHRALGKHMISKPVRYRSPFKGGIILRPPPDVHQAMNLLEYLCADDSPFKSTTVIQSGSTHLNGSVIAQSFADDSLPDPIFMSAFVKCVTYDDYWIRPECHGYRIFLGPEVSAILNVEWCRRDTSVPKYSQAAAAAAIQLCLPFTNLKKTKMILLPVLHQDHWSVYCVNFVHSRIDVLDSRDYNSQGAAPHKFVRFRNWRHVQVNVPVQKAPSDSAFFAMKFLEWYDGEGHGKVQTNIDTDRSKELRAEMLYYITYHSENKVNKLPHGLLQFRIDDQHPFFY